MCGKSHEISAKRDLSATADRRVCAMQFLVPLIIVVVLVVVGFGIYSSFRRRKEMIVWSSRNGLSFDPRHDYSMDSRFAEFTCLDRGHSRYAYNIMRGLWSEPGDEDDPLPICAFDYHYVTGSGKNRTTHRFSAVIVESPIPLKGLFIRPEGFFDKVSEFFGADDIDFESAEFSREFYVKSLDKRWAYDVIHQRMMEYLLRVPRFHVQFSRTHVIAWRSRCFSVADFGTAVRLIRGMLKRLPDYLVRRQLGQD